MTSLFVRRFASALLLSCAMAAPAAAQTKPTAPAATAAKPVTPEHLALARAVLDFTGAGKSFDSVVTKLLVDARQSIIRTSPTLQPDLDVVISDLNTKMKNSDEELINKIAAVYAQKLSEAELKDIVAFYQSPAGQKMTSSMPEILRESYGLAREWSQQMSVEIMKQVRAEMKKKGHEI